eukprot:998951-Rhodomonas_salina.1
MSLSLAFFSSCCLVLEAGARARELASGAQTWHLVSLPSDHTAPSRIHASWLPFPLSPVRTSASSCRPGCRCSLFPTRSWSGPSESALIRGVFRVLAGCLHQLQVLDWQLCVLVPRCAGTCARLTPIIMRSTPTIMSQHFPRQHLTACSGAATGSKAFEAYRSMPARSYAPRPLLLVKLPGSKAVGCPFGLAWCASRPTFPLELG